MIYLPLYFISFLQIRRQNIENAKKAHVRAANSTDIKIKGLTVQVRHRAIALIFFLYVIFSLFLYDYLLFSGAGTLLQGIKNSVVRKLSTIAFGK